MHGSIEVFSQAHQWIVTIMDHASQQNFSQDWLMNWIKPIHKGGDFNITLWNYHGASTVYNGTKGCLMTP